MGRFSEAVKAGVKGFKEADEPREYLLGGKTVRCPHCGETRFVEGTALLTTRGATAFGLDWTNPSATTLICAECGRIEWFAQEPAG